MKNIMSNANDCRELRKLLVEKMNQGLKWNKIEFDNCYSNIIVGRYYSFPYDYYNFNSSERDCDCITFSMKYCKNECLRLSIQEEVSPQTMEHKLAVLSDFYEALKEKFGEPTLFYTLKNDDAKQLCLQWSFINREEDILNFQQDTAFDDANVDKLILFGEKENPSSETTRGNIVRKIGLPWELIPLIEEHMEEFMKYKHKKEIGYPTNYQLGTLETKEKQMKKMYQ